MTGVFIIGNRVKLRALREKDTEGPYVQWFNDAEVCKYNSHHIYPYTKSDGKEYIEKVRKSKDMIALAIVTKKGGRHIGNISLQNINPISKSAEFAIIIGDKDYWGKGYAKEAANLLVDHGFSQMNLNRIYCGTTSENVPMQRLAKFLGMKKEGLRRKAAFKNNKYVDILEYGVLKDEFTPY